MTNNVISARPATNVLAKVYQLYMVENQCASMLISQSQGAVDITVNTNQTMNNEAQTVLVKIYLLLSATDGGGLLSRSYESLRILCPRILHRPMIRIVQIVKNVGLKKELLPFNTSSALTAAVSVH